MYADIGSQDLALPFKDFQLIKVAQSCKHFWACSSDNPEKLQIPTALVVTKILEC